MNIFTKDDVGKKVTSVGFGDGVIIALEADNSVYPVLCKFRSGLSNFDINGICCTDEVFNKWGITLVDTDNCSETVEEPTTMEEWNNQVKYATGGIIVPDRLTAEEWAAKYAPNRSKAVFPQVIDNGKIVALTPELLAEAFWELGDCGKAAFYLRLSVLSLGKDKC